MSDFFDDIENIDTRDVSQKHWDMTFEIRVLREYSLNQHQITIITKLINRNINACNFRNSEITEYEITENCAYIEKLPAKRLSWHDDYKKTIFVNFNGVFNSIEDAVELLSAVIFTKDGFILDETTLEILFWRNDTYHSLIVTKETVCIFRKDNSFTVDKQLAHTHTKIILETITMVRDMLDNRCDVRYNEICYLLNTYILSCAISVILLKEHRILLEAEDCMPANSTLHGYSTIDVANIPFSWNDEDTLFVANSCDPSKSYHSPKTNKAVNMSVVEQLLFNTPQDILVTISLNDLLKFKSLSEKKCVRDEYWWHDVYEMNDTNGVCVVDSNKDIEQPQMVKSFLENYKSEIRHSRKMERQMQIFHNSKKNTAGVVIDLCMYYSKIYNKIALVTLGLYGDADRVYDFKDRLFNITNPRG